MTMPGTVEERIALPGRPPVGGVEDGPGLTARDLWSMFRRRLVLISVLFILFSAMAVGGFVLWWTKFPGYTSVALIECISNIPRAELSPEQVRLRQDEHERFVLSLAQLLKNQTILEEVLKLNAVRETQWWKDIEAERWKRPNEHHIRLAEEIKAGPMRGTNYLKVSMECRHPKDPAVIVNGLVTQWYETVKRRSASRFAGSPLTAAQSELEALDQEILEARGRLRSLGEKLPPGARQNPGGNITNQEVAQLSAQATQLQLELTQLAQFQAIYHDTDVLAISAEDKAWIEDDPEVQALKQNLFLMRRRRAADEKIYGSAHRVLKQDDLEIQASQTELDRLRTEKIRERRNDMRAASNTALSNTRHAWFLAKNKLAKATAALQDQDRLLLEDANLETDIEHKLEYRRELSNYIKSLKRVVAQRTAVDVSIAQKPTDPLERSSPHLILLPVGVFLALCLAVGTGVGLELLDTSVRTSQDILRHLRVALLGQVPDTDDEEVPITHVERAFRDAPLSMIAEAFRRIRTNLQFAAPAERQRLVLVTSPRAEDGKTTVACNLAMACAQGGRRVLLIDANFRRPRIHSVFGVKSERGLSNLLIGDGTLSSCIQSTDDPMVDALSSGPMPPNPAELLSGEAFTAVLAEAKQRYDQVILDAAPVLLASDTEVIGPLVDGVILVVRAKQNSRGIARRAFTLLTDIGAHVFGVVLNAAQATRGGYFRQQLRDYYDYQEEMKGTTALPTPPISSNRIDV